MQVLGGSYAYKYSTFVRAPVTSNKIQQMMKHLLIRTPQALIAPVQGTLLSRQPLSAWYEKLNAGESKDDCAQISKGLIVHII